MIKQVPPKVLLDSSFLLTLLKQHRDPEAEIRAGVHSALEIVVLDLVLLEIERLVRKGTFTTRKWASTVLALLEAHRYHIEEHGQGPSDVDATIIAFALSTREPVWVATVDSALRNALRAVGVPVIMPRKNHGLLVDSNLLAT